MSIITDEQFKQFIDDSKWLQKNYNELIKEFNLEFIAIRNHQVVAHHKEMNEFERELKQSNIAILDVVVEFIRDKRNEVLYIECYQCFNDKRYYVPAYVFSKPLDFVLRINFLVDTGSSTTLLSWNEVPYATLKTNLREDRVFTGMGGSFKAFILPECSLFFYTNTGIHNLVVGELGLSNYLTVDGRLCPAVPSVLGIDILNKFYISYSDDLERLFLTQNISK